MKNRFDKEIVVIAFLTLLAIIVTAMVLTQPTIAQDDVFRRGGM